MNFDIVNILQRKWVIPTITGVVGFIGGAGFGYFFSQKSATKTVEYIDEENPQISLFDKYQEGGLVDLVKEPYSPIQNPIKEISILEPTDGDAVEWKGFEEHNDKSYKEPLRINYSDPEAEVMVVDAVTSNKNENLVNPDSYLDEVEPIKEERELETVNVFSDNSDEWDFRKEIPFRTPVAPYVIHFDEFEADEADCAQETLTYYSGDDIVADQTDQPIYNYKSLMGDLQFGHGSNDMNVVYIRNLAIKMEWEVLLHTGTYSEEVLGLEIEQQYEAQDLKHSTNRKFRME